MVTSYNEHKRKICVILLMLTSQFQRNQITLNKQNKHPCSCTFLFLSSNNMDFDQKMVLLNKIVNSRKDTGQQYLQSVR
jgi:hypothetical protein